jgi:hypothetical protein
MKNYESTGAVKTSLESLNIKGKNNNKVKQT